MVLKILLSLYILWLSFIIYKNGISNYICDIKEHVDKIIYTCRHKKAYLKIQKKYKPYKYTLRGIFHDTDKILLLVFSIMFYPFVSVQEISRIHKKWSHHHHLAKTDEDFYYQIIDYECARFTKEDKPLGAREYIGKKYISNEITEEDYNRYVTIMDDIGIEKLEKEK